MKPTRGRVYCKESGKHRLWFENEKKAYLFIKFNSEDIEAESGFAPNRAYYCISCDGWHVTSKEAGNYLKSRSEIMIDKLREDKEKRELAKAKARMRKEEMQFELKKLLQNAETLINSAIEKLKEGNLNQCTDFLNKAFGELNESKKISGFKKEKGKLEAAIHEMHRKIRIIVKENLRMLKEKAKSGTVGEGGQRRSRRKTKLTEWERMRGNIGWGDKFDKEYFHNLVCTI